MTPCTSRWPTRRPFVAVWLAVTVLGATLVPSDPQASARELADCMRRTRAVLGVGSVRRADGYREAADGSSRPCLWRWWTRTTPCCRRSARAAAAGDAAGDAAGSRPAAGHHVHLGNHQPAEGGGPHPGELRLHRRRDGRGGRPWARATASWWRCRCSTPTRSTTPSRPPFRVGASVALLQPLLRVTVRRAGGAAPGHPREPVRRAHPDDPGPLRGRARAATGCGTAGSRRTSRPRSTTTSAGCSAAGRGSCTG